ncbi:2-hydroxychromene-2-carboxylate isomerase [Hydrogenophaga sp.]|uniref:2-hydroxychromene-2-carboxylate isomerase n=1 Tax=Hydrogenophaga sp. TaxID=1904254 RepID=UPI0019B09915|nr:2-hydroxychromene-2-carboxylate isomerase [Hydrogenophaga sp.]MBD3893720.1 2-hydroxychromene-2-carboxylate isomerase [Hydrogenophaga sp.]
MEDITFFYDPLSPYAYLAFECLPQALQGHSLRLRYQPVLLGALLKAHGLRGPAEIPAKRQWMLRQVNWLARQHGVPLDWPAEHPFSSLALLRLGLACASEDAPTQTNRYVTEQLFHFVWRGGHSASDPTRLAQLQDRLQTHMAQREKPWLAPDSEAVKQRLRANTDAALALGAFGVPTCLLRGELFWGLDALPMLRERLAQGGAEAAEAGL